MAEVGIKSPVLIWIKTNAPIISAFAEAISVSAVNERNNSGKVSVLVILKSDLVMPTLAMLADSRFVIVRSI